MTPDDLERRIVLEQDGLLVMDKPPGMPTSGRHLQDDDCLQYWLIQRHGGMVWAVHQLDADTSGVNLFVTHKGLVDVFHRRLRDPETAKRYLAIVHGVPAWDSRIVEAPIGTIGDRGLGVSPDGKTAWTRFGVLDRATDTALLEARIRTGRTHQIRIHLGHLGHPLVGEEWYRRPPCTAHPRQALHAWRLSLAPSGAGDDLDITIPLPPDLRRLADRYGLDRPS